MQQRASSQGRCGRPRRRRVRENALKLSTAKFFTHNGQTWTERTSAISFSVHLSGCPQKRHAKEQRSKLHSMAAMARDRLIESSGGHGRFTRPSSASKGAQRIISSEVRVCFPVRTVAFDANFDQVAGCSLRSSHSLSDSHSEDVIRVKARIGHVV
jgi:hypothetical protein